MQYNTFELEKSAWEMARNVEDWNVAKKPANGVIQEFDMPCLSPNR